MHAPNLTVCMSVSADTGAVAGALVNHFLPGWLVMVMLVVLLTATTQRTLKKGLTLWKKESKQSGQ